MKCENEIDGNCVETLDACKNCLALYQFPAVRFVTNSPWRQWWHLFSEVIEVATALLRGDLQHAATEVWNVKHSAETMHRIMADRGADIEAGRIETLSDNLERGYYES